MADAIKYTNKLSGARILIVGGTSGIGFAVAEACLEYGSTVTISSSQPSRVESSIQRLLKSYPSAKDRLSGYACDLASPSSEDNVKALFDKVGNLNHIVFTAGDPLAVMPLEEATVEKIQQAGMVRFVGALMVAKHGASHLAPGPSSSITLTTGTVSEKPIGGWTVAASYAGGLHSMTRNLALDLKPTRVNLICPGFVETELWDSMPKSSLTRMTDWMKSGGHTTGELAQPGDIAEAYLYCMRGRSVTGSVIDTNSGTLLTGH